MPTYISDLDHTVPKGSGTDGQRADGHTHIKNIKQAYLDSFPIVTGPVTVTHTELNRIAETVEPMTIYRSEFSLNSDAGGDDTYVLTIAGIDSYTDGLRVTLKITTALSVSGTLNINSLGAISIADMFGDPATAPAGSVLKVIYDSGVFVLLNDQS